MYAEIKTDPLNGTTQFRAERLPINNENAPLKQRGEDLLEANSD